LSLSGYRQISAVTVPSCFFWIRQHHQKCQYGTHFPTITNGTPVPCNKSAQDYNLPSWRYISSHQNKCGEWPVVMFTAKYRHHVLSWPWYCLLSQSHFICRTLLIENVTDIAVWQIFVWVCCWMLAEGVLKVHIFFIKEIH
jgi:hypothetical protein